MFASLLPVYGEYTLRLLNTLRSRISYMRLFAIAPHNSLRSDNAPQPQLACMKYTEALLSSVNGAYILPSRTEQNWRQNIVIISNFLFSPAGGISSASPQPGRPRTTAAKGRENSPGVWWHHKDDMENERRGLNSIHIFKIFR